MNEIYNIFVKLIPILVSVLLILIIYYSLILGNKYVTTKNKVTIKKRNFISIAIGIIAILIIYRVFDNGGFIVDMLYTIISAIVLAYLLDPLVKVMERKKISRTLSIVIVYLIVIGLLVSFALMIGPKIVEELVTLSKNLPTYLNNAYKFTIENYDKLSKYIDNPTFDSLIEKTLKGLKDVSLKTLISTVGALVKFFSKVLNVVMIPVFTFYFLKDKQMFITNIKRLIPKKRRQDVLFLGNEIDNILGKYIKGQLIVCLFIGVLTSIVLSILKIDFAIIIGIFAGITNVIPYLGPIVGLVPAVIFAALDDPIKIIWVIIAITVIQQIESNFVSPNVVGNSVGIHPAVIMTTVLLAGSYFGIIGMLFAVPSLTVIRILIKFFKRKIKELEDDSIIPME